MGKSSNDPSSIVIKLFPRLHLTLIGMNAEGYRINGGIGFTVQHPNIELNIKPSKRLYIIDRRRHPLSSSGQERLSSIIQKVVQELKFDTNIKVEVKGSARTHFGFGTGTSIRLACLESLFIFNHLNCTPEQLRLLSNRGGTSGIGIYTYFRGGWVFDLGRKTDTTHSSQFLPSSFRENERSMPLLMQHTKMPPWEIGICIPNGVKVINEKQEQRFFNKTCPLNKASVDETLYHALYGLHASVIENDIATFSKALMATQIGAWKAAERRLYGVKLKFIEKSLYESGAKSVGMSSLGPTLFFLADNVENVLAEMKEKDANCELICTSPRNQGRLIIYA